MKYVVRVLVASVCLFGFSVGYTQQGNDSKSQDLGKPGEIVLSISPSFTWIPKGADLDNRNDEGHFAPGFGTDFFYRFHPRWEIGLMADIEFAEYIIPRKDDLRRERAFVMTAMGAFTISPRWNIFFGGGMEIEKNESFALARLGVEYAIPLQKKWFIPIGGFIDFKPGYDTWSMMFGIGRRL